MLDMPRENIILSICFAGFAGIIPQKRPRPLGPRSFIQLAL
jgi:hypothetical protein